MKKQKSRGKTPSLISGKNGRPKRVLVGRKSDCYRCKTVFNKDETCIAIPQTGNAFATDKRVCDICYQEILNQTVKDLEEIRQL